MTIEDNGNGINDDEIDMSGLSDEERAALAGSDDELEALNKLAGEGSNEEEDDEDDDPAKNSAGAEEGGTAAANAEPQHQVTNEEDEEPAPFVPQYVAQPVENYADQLKELNLQKADALKKMMEGEMTAEEYAEFETDITHKRDALRDQQIKAQISSEQQEQFSHQQWNWEVERFLKDAAKEGIHYRSNPALNGAFDTTIKALAVDPANAEQDAGWFLTEAHRLVKDTFNLGANSSARPATEKDKPRVPDLSNIPPNLGQVPAASPAETGGSEFAHLSKLEGYELELALAKMTPEQQDRYLMSNE